MTNQSFIRNMNERRILSLLHREGSLSRAEIARRLSLTRSALTYLTENLIGQGLVRETATPRSDAPRDVGRPSVALTLDPSGAYFVGVEIGVTVIRLALVDMNVAPVRTRTIPVSSPRPEEALAAIADFLDGCEAEQAFAGRVRAVGVTVPGLVRGDGLVLHLPILGWRDVNFLEAAGQVLTIPVSIENNANAAAFGDVYQQPKLSEELILFLKLGNGCGGAAIVNGRLLRGSSGGATEFGHMRVAEDGPRCHCGQVGCLETHVNLSALSRYLAEAGLDHAPDPARVAAAMRGGDKPTLAAVRRLTSALSRGLVSLTNIFNPSEIVLGGQLRPVLEAGMGDIRADVEAGIVAGLGMPEIALSTDNEFECAMGAAAIAHHEQFDATAISITGR